MKKELFSSVLPMLFPVGLCCLPTMASGGYHRTYMRSSSTIQQSLVQSNNRFLVKPKKESVKDSSDLNLISGQVFSELIIIDAAVPDKHLFYQQVRPGADIFEINSTEDGLVQLENILKKHLNLSALHIVSHAKDGVLYLGNNQVTQASLGERLNFLANMDNALKDGADVLFYGCNLAKTKNGEALLELISKQASVDVAASNDPTGNSQLNGDWDLEIHKGDIDTVPRFDSIAMADFSEILAFSGTLNLDNMPTGYAASKSYTIPTTSYVLEVVSGGGGGNDLYNFASGYVYVGTGGSGAGHTNTAIYFSNNETFNLTGLYVYNSDNASRVIRVTSDKGGTVDSASLTQNNGETLSFTGSNWEGINRITIQYDNGAQMDWTKIDNIALVNVVTANTTPTISIDNSNLAFTEGDAATQVDSAGTVSDADGDADWNGGTLSAQITANSEAGDEISISDTDGDGTAITISGTNILSNGADIGDLSTSGGVVTGGTALTITFDSDATNANVQEVLQSIRYRTTSDSPGTSNRTVTLTATDTNAGSANDTRTISVAALDNDGSLTAAGTVSEPVAIDTTVDTVGEAVDVFDFTLSDGGSTDSAAMAVSQIVLNVSGTASDTVRDQITWRLNGNDASNVTGVYNSGADTITFSGLSISIANGGSEVYTVNAYYNDNTGITDNQTIILSVDGDTDLTVASTTGTGMGSTAAVTNSTGSTLNVNATALAFTTQPASSTSGSALNTQPVVTAQDSFGNTDTDFTETITVTEASAGTLSNASVAASSGVATFGSLTYTATADQQSFTLTANDQDGVGSNLPTVDASSVTSDVVATQLIFDTQPVPLMVNSGSATNLTTVPVVSARDGNSVVDTGYSTDIVLAEVNGAGSATMSATGDTDGSSATVTLSPSSGVASYSSMQITYTVSGGSSETFNLQASSGGLSTANSSQLTGLVPDSDGTLTSAGTVSEPVALNLSVDTIGEAVDLFDFTLTDGGTADGLSMNISAITLNVSGTASDAERANVTWRLDGSDASNVTGTYNAGSDTITFTGLSISIADGGSEVYTINGYYNDNSGLTDGNTLILSVDGDTDLTLGSGTQMGSTSAGKQ